MSQRLQTILEEIGLSSQEARVYLTVLRNPEARLSTVAHHALIPRTTAYSILNSLLRKGFVDVLVKRRRRFFVATPPQRIRKDLTERLEAFNEAMPRFVRHRTHGPPSPRVHFLDGKDGIRTAFKNILEERMPFVAITSLEDMERVSSDYFAEFIERRIAQRLPVRLLTNRCASALRLKERDTKEFRETRFVPQTYRFHTANYIFGNTVALLSLRLQPPTALIIEDSDIAKTCRMYFDLLWENAEIR